MSLKVPENARLEIKFVAYNIYLHHVLHWLHMHSAGFIKSFPDRKVNNIYFDTHNCNAFEENISGASSRTKVRYRWYSSSEYPDTGTLELKCKRNCFGWKLLYKVDKPPYLPGADWNTIRKLISEQLPDVAQRHMEENPVPMILNRYKRRYFISRDMKVRVTIDTDQEVLEQRYNSYPNLTTSAYNNDMFVVEFKLDRKHRDLATEILRSIPIRQSRHSKYIMGVRTVSGI